MYHSKLSPEEQQKQQALLSGTQDFSTLSRVVFQPHCLSCHSDALPTQGISFSSYSSTMQSGVVVTHSAATSRLYTAVQSGLMPSGGPRLSDQQISAIASWINEGAIEALPGGVSVTTTTVPLGPTTTTTTAPRGVTTTTRRPGATTTTTRPGATTTTTIPPTYTWIRTNLTPRCTGCHGGSAPSAGIDMTTYSGVSANASLMKAAMANGSMPKGGPVVPAADQQVFSNWIAAGKPNN